MSEKLPLREDVERARNFQGRLSDRPQPPGGTIYWPGIRFVPELAKEFAAARSQGQNVPDEGNTVLEFKKWLYGGFRNSEECMEKVRELVAIHYGAGMAAGRLEEAQWWHDGLSTTGAPHECSDPSRSSYHSCQRIVALRADLKKQEEERDLLKSLEESWRGMAELLAKSRRGKE